MPQIPGTLRGSRPIRGAAETFVKTKRYVAALAVLQPELLLADWLLYEKRGRWHVGLDAIAIGPAAWQPMALEPAEPSVSSEE